MHDQIAVLVELAINPFLDQLNEIEHCQWAYAEEESDDVEHGYTIVIWGNVRDVIEIVQDVFEYTIDEVIPL